MSNRAEQLQFGLLTTDKYQRLYMDMPTNALHQLQELPGAGKRLKWAKSNQVRAIDLEPGEARSRMFVNFKKMGNIRDDTQKRDTEGVVASLINDVQAFAEDPLMSVEVGTGSTSTSRSSLQMAVVWPAAEDASLQTLATNTMRNTAEQLKYVAKYYFPELVYAQVHRPTGVSLFANDIGGCEASTYGGYYKPSEPKFELSAGNLYYPDMQLICFSGAVAMSHADELLAST